MKQYPEKRGLQIQLAKAFERKGDYGGAVKIWVELRGKHGRSQVIKRGWKEALENLKMTRLKST